MKSVSEILQQVMEYIKNKVFKTFAVEAVAHFLDFSNCNFLFLMFAQIIAPDATFSSYLNWVSKPVKAFIIRHQDIVQWWAEVEKCFVQINHIWYKIWINLALHGFFFLHRHEAEWVVSPIYCI